MKLDLFLQKTSNIQLKNQVYRFAVIVFAAAIVANSFYTYRMLREQRIIVIPPGGVKTKVEVSMTSADENYLKMMTRYVSGLYLTYSPATARTQFSELLTLYHPSRYEEGKVFLYDLADKVEISKVTSVFNMDSMEYETGPGGVFSIKVKGMRALYARGRQIEGKNLVFVLTGRIEGARFYIEDMGETRK